MRRLFPGGRAARSACSCGSAAAGMHRGRRPPPTAN